MTSYKVVYLTSSFAAIGGFLFGYDLGVISGVIVSPSFTKYFEPINTTKQGLIVSTLMGGCFLGSLMAGFTSEYLGRKRTISLASIIFILGALLQCFAKFISMLYLGRLIAGVGIGHLSMVIPMYLSEISPMELRGRLVGFQQISVTIGVAISFWIDFACRDLSDNLPWRLPLGLQALPAIVLGIGCLFLPESPRWLILKNKEDLALNNLLKLRNNDLDSANQELILIKEANMLVVNSKSTYSELVSPSLRGRLIRGVTLQALHQLSGVIGIIYYAPIIFKTTAGLSSLKATLLTQGINGLVHVLSTIPAILYVDKWGRRPMLLTGGIIMTISMLLVGILSGTFDITQASTSPVVGYAIIFFVFLFIGAFSCTWGPVGWIYPTEIFPNNIRAKALSITTATNLLFNYLVGLFVPMLLEKLGFIIYLLFSGVGIVMVLVVYLFFPETKGKSLEDINLIFDTKKSPFTKDMVKEKI